MSAPTWARLLLSFLAPEDRVDDVLGDLEETHGLYMRSKGPLKARLRTGLETLDMSFALLRGRVSGERTQDPTTQEAQPRVPPKGPSISWLDFKLGFRMLLKYPGLTTVAGIAIAFAMAVGSGTVEFATDFFYPTLPFDQGDRIVQIRNRDLATGGTDHRALHDFELWRQSAQSVVEIGAMRNYRRNVINDDGQARPVLGAEMTAAALSLPRVLPIMGRPLTEADEEPGATEVVVIGHDLWTSLFNRDRDILGKVVRLGAQPATIVGVMPQGFTYPHNHAAWSALRLDAFDYPRGESPAIAVVGRLAPGADLEDAGAEFQTIGLRAASDFPGSNEHLRPSVIQFGRFPAIANSWLAGGLYFGVFLGFCMLMLLVCANVALLLFARTAARESEITVRTALGATRGRIMMQLFAEALVLALLASVVGLWGGHVGVAWVIEQMKSFDGGEIFGFWIDSRLSANTVVVALGLAVLTAALAGIVPALKATGKGVQPALQRAGGGRGGPSFGRLWTGVIVSQIALTVAFVPVVIVIGYQTLEIRAAETGFQADQYLTVRVQPGEESPTAALDAPAEPGVQSAVGQFVELKRRLANDSQVSGAAISSHVPGANHPLRWIAVEGPAAASASARGHRVATGSVDEDVFNVLRAPILAGRGFRASDLAPGREVVVVNEDFVRVVLEDRNPLGRRFSYADPDRNPDEEPGQTYEIVGVVSQLAMQIDPDLNSGAGVYHPLRLEEAESVHIVMGVGPNPTSFTQALYEVALDVDPTLLLSDVRPMDEGAWQTEQLYQSWFWVILGAGGIGLLLTLAGIYSIMAFTVSRRTREIGVRVALGAAANRVVGTILSRALGQVAAGVVTGGALFAAFVFLASEGTFRPGPRELVFAVVYLIVMTMVCLLACAVPTRRALAIEPTEALRAEG